jgi:hypothetical protein
MYRPRLEPGQTEFSEPFANRADMHINGPAAGHFGLQIHAPPANHVVDCQVRPLDYQFAQFGLLRLGQSGYLAWALAGLQPFQAGCVVTMYPVAKGLAIHAIRSRRLTAWPPIKDKR